MPIRWPAVSTRAPPEFPVLIAASVWMKFSKVLIPSRLRPVALTMPSVTVWPTPKGVGEDDRVQVLVRHLQHGEVGLRISPDKTRLGHLAVGQHHGDLVGAVDHMVVGEDVAMLGNDLAGAKARLPLLRVLIRVARRSPPAFRPLRWCLSGVHVDDGSRSHSGSGTKARIHARWPGG